MRIVKLLLIVGALGLFGGLAYSQGTNIYVNNSILLNGVFTPVVVMSPRAGRQSFCLRARSGNGPNVDCWAYAGAVVPTGTPSPAAYYELAPANTLCDTSADIVTAAVPEGWVCVAASTPAATPIVDSVDR